VARRKQFTHKSLLRFSIRAPDDLKAPRAEKRDKKLRSFPNRQSETQNCTYRTKWWSLKHLKLILSRTAATTPKSRLRPSKGSLESRAVPSSPPPKTIRTPNPRISHCSPSKHTQKIRLLDSGHILKSKFRPSKGLLSRARQNSTPLPIGSPKFEATNIIQFGDSL